MSEQQSGHPLYQTPKNNHPLSDMPPEKPKPQGRGIPIPMAAKVPIVTYTLIAVNVAIFLLRYLAPDLGQQVLFGGYTDTQLVLEGKQFYRLFTSMFLHFNEMHLIFNMIALNYIGSNLERLFGHVRFTLIYVLGGLAGSVLPLFFSSGGLGASGAVFAIWGAEAVFLYQHQQLFGAAGKARLRNSLFYMGFNFLFGFSANALATVADSGIRIGNSAHFGGLVGGAILGWLIGARFVVQRKIDPETSLPEIEIVQTRKLENQVQVILYFCIGLLAVLFVAMLLRA